MKNTSKKAKDILLNLGCDIAGSFLFAVAVQCFTSSNQIAPGGVTGISTILNYLFNLPIGILIFVLNVPLLAVGFKYFGKNFTLRTLVTIFIQSVMVDLCALFLPVYTGNKLLAALFGGIVMGAGLGLIFMRGSTTGGTDIVSRLLQRRFPHLQLGRTIFMCDLVVILLSAIAYRSIDSALYAIVTIFASSKIVDGILYGMDQGKLVYVFSSKSEQIAKDIITEVDRGVTLLDARGGYSGKETNVILCAVRNSEYHSLKEIAHRHDPNAFIIVTGTSEVRGEGFKAINSQ